MDQPERGPIILEGHEGEATSVDWYVLHTIVVFFCVNLINHPMFRFQYDFFTIFRCASEVGKIATSSDDSKVSM